MGRRKTRRSIKELLRTDPNNEELQVNFERFHCKVKKEIEEE
jgi:hypothetical protein